MSEESKKERTKGKLDTWQIVFAAGLAVLLPAVSSILPKMIPPMFSQALLAGIGGGLGIFIGLKLKSKSNIFKSVAFIGSVLSVLLILIIGNLIIELNKPFSEELAAFSESINENCPANLDQQTRMDMTKSGPGNQLTFYYTILDSSSNEIDAENLIKTLKPKMVVKLKSKNELKFLRDNEVEFVHVYRDKNNQEAFRISISPKDYI